MFKKKPQIKTLSPLRSSDRRKLADKIIQDYGLVAATSSGPDQSTDQTAAHTALRRSLLPDNALSAKITTTAGPDLKEVVGTVYVGSHGAPEQRVLWIRIEDVIYPSVYSLWKNPRLVPLLRTPSLVVDKIKAGADLMTPGLQGPPFPAKAKQGSVVCVASLDCPSVPLIVGTCAIDISALQKAQGQKGRAVEVFHFAGDELWDWSTSGKAGKKPPEELSEWMTDPEPQAEVAMKSLEIADDEVDGDGGVSLSADAGPRLEDADGPVEVVDAVPDMTLKEIDDAFRKAFLYGVHHALTTKRSEPKHGLDFPLSQSIFMSDLVQPYLPIHTPAHAQALQMKKTSWKTARKFIKALDKDNLLLSKDHKTEAMVLDIDFDDQQFQRFEPYRLPKKDSAGSATPGTKTAAESGADDSVGQKIKVAVLYRPREGLSPLFEGPNTPKLPYYNGTEIRAAVTGYIEASGLVDAANKRLVKIDPVIANAVLSSGSKADADAIAKGTIPRDVLIEKITSLSALSHAILRNEESIDSAKAKPKSGPAPKVGILIETRGGNKTVTRVYGFESFFIKPQPLADELRRTCASSTSVEPFKSGKGMEVMVQGPQQDAVLKALLRRGLNKSWVDVTDKTKGKKK